jgi:hypothetical protein
VRTEFVNALLFAARGTVGVTETSRNSGPEIDEWLKYARSKPGQPWCAAYVAFMHRIAAVSCDVLNPCPRTAGALQMYALSDAECRVDLPAPGDVFTLDTGEPGGAGHTGIVETVSPDGNTIGSIEGNSGANGTREGIAVVRQTWKPRTGKRGRLIGFLRFANLLPDDVPEPLPLGVLPPSPFK